jgi:two-component system invasion response regulator UvrY
LINVLLVDDHELVRTGTQRILDDVRGIKVIGMAETGEEAVSFCRDHTPDIILMDMNMPGIGGMEATRRILRMKPDVKVIALTIHTEDPFPAKIMQTGAHGYLSKSAGTSEVIRAVKAVHMGQRYIAPEIAQQIALNQFKPNRSENPFDNLTDRELQIMLKIIKGARVQDVAEELTLSTKTVNSYRYRMFQKLGISGDVELVHLAVRHGMLDIEKEQ